ncbi:MAG: hypothetical protein OHK0046_16390 [Anaerolineae bacterium]
MNLFRAEWQKITGNRWVAASLIWIFPAGAAFFMIAAVVIALLSEDFQRAQMQLGIVPWNETLVNAWTIVNNELGRWMIVAFSAFIFAGEYQHGTWKNLTTRRTRTRLILNKFLTLGVFVVFATVLMTVILGIGTGVVASIIDLDYGLSTFGDAFGPFVEDYFTQMFIILTIVLIGASYAALAAMLTKSVFASAIVGVLVTVAENGILLPILLARSFLGWDLMFLYFLTPSFNMANIGTWLNTNRPYMPFGDDMMAYSLERSVIVVGVWVVALIILTVYLFRRQDIST